MRTQNRIEKETTLTLEDAVIGAPHSGVAQIVVHNCCGVTQSIPMGACLGEAEAARVLSVPEPGE